MNSDSECTFSDLNSNGSKSNTFAFDFNTVCDPSEVNTVDLCDLVSDYLSLNTGVNWVSANGVNVNGLYVRVIER